MIIIQSQPQKEVMAVDADDHRNAKDVHLFATVVGDLDWVHRVAMIFRLQLPAGKPTLLSSTIQMPAAPNFAKRLDPDNFAAGFRKTRPVTRSTLVSDGGSVVLTGRFVSSRVRVKATRRIALHSQFQPVNFTFP